MATNAAPCPVVEKDAFGAPHICLFPTCKLNVGDVIYEKAVDKFSRSAMENTMRGFLLSARRVEAYDGYWDLIPDDQDFCKCNECIREAIDGDAQGPAMLQFVKCMKEVLSRSG